jgi:hypothetical protein
VALTAVLWSGHPESPAVGPVSGPIVEQQGHPGSRGFDNTIDRARERDAHARLIAERPAGADTRPLTVHITRDERAALGVSEPGSRKLRVGTVKALNASVRFDDLTPATLRGRKVREHGVLEGTDDGGLVWTASVRSEGAAALQLRIDSFFLPPRAELWVYTTAGEAHGPYSWAGPEGSRAFWTHSVSGAEALVQLRMRGPVSQGDLHRLGFVVADVAHIDDASLRGGGPDAQPAAGFCSYNAPCVESGECAGPAWDDVRNAVAHIRFVSGPYVYICSGGLVADSDAASSIPYFLTANHCISRAGEASSMEAYFRFRAETLNCSSTTGCTTGPPASVPRTRGATIVSSSKTSDYTLLRLSEAAPGGSYFLGWSTAPVANSNGVQLFRFSHPLGAPQAYSEHVVDTSKVTCGSWPRGGWIYSKDARGATEGGSSGSPVVNGSKQIVGQLSGACGFNLNDKCDEESNATVDGAFANYYGAVAPYLGSGASNQPPTASFVVSCTGLTCNFDGSGSSDLGGSIVSYAWNFGDGTTGSGALTSHTYASGGNFTAMLTVTDNGGATGSTTRPVSVTAPGGSITLTATGVKVKGVQQANLSWAGASTTNVAITRTGTSGTTFTTVNDGVHTDNIGAKGGGSYLYRVCETGATPTCSPQVPVVF